MMKYVCHLYGAHRRNGSDAKKRLNVGYGMLVRSVRIQVKLTKPYA